MEEDPVVVTAGSGEVDDVDDECEVVDAGAAGRRCVSTIATSLLSARGAKVGAITPPPPIDAYNYDSGLFS